MDFGSRDSSQIPQTMYVPSHGNIIISDNLCYGDMHNTCMVGNLNHYNYMILHQQETNAVLLDYQMNQTIAPCTCPKLLQVLD